MRIKLHYLLALFVLPALSSCYPKGAEYNEELDLVYTNYNPDFDFSSKLTYALPDSIIKIAGNDFLDPDGDNKPEFLNPANTKLIFDKVIANMTAYGWTKVDKNANPDVILLVSTVTTTNLYYYYDWGYWGWWYPGYYPPWGWYYPGYYPPYITGYRSGSVFMQMVDSKAAPGSENVAVEWSAILNGLAEGADLQSRVQQMIDAAYAQSTYLKH